MRNSDRIPVSFPSALDQGLHALFGEGLHFGFDQVLAAALRLAVVLLMVAALPARAQFIVSEVMADPSALADAQGEFVELANAGERAETAEAARLIVDGDTLELGRLSLAPGEHWLLCRDSAAMAAAGADCRMALGGLALANSRPLGVAVLWRDMRSAFEVPVARAGVSWENTWDDGKGLLGFARSAAGFGAGDSATPGFRNSRSLRPALRDLAVERAEIGPDRDGGILRVTVRSLGAESAEGWLAVRLDADWDGRAETQVDSVRVGKGGGEMHIPLGPDHLGVLVAALSGDENPANDLAAVFRGAGKTLEIAEVCPAPAEGPEWAEIRNATGEGGGHARPLDLGRVAWNGRMLGPGAGRLLPGEHLLLAEDAAALREYLGPLKVRILSAPGWGALRNSGDTCRLSLGLGPAAGASSATAAGAAAGAATEAATPWSRPGADAWALLDALAYGPGEAATGSCLARVSAPAAGGNPGPGPAAAAPQSAPTPGYPARAGAARLAMAASRRVLGPGESAEVTVEAPAGTSYGLRVFDLEGNCRRLLARGGPGRHSHAWSGEGERGNRLPPGPYILGLSSSAGSLRRMVILAGEP